MRQVGSGLDDFVRQRVRAEETARVRAWGRGLDEVTLEEIYAELGPRLGLTAAAQAELQALELDCERDALAPLAGGCELLARARAAGKTVAIVSDTYFDRRFIAEIVARAGLDGVRFFISSEERKTKLSGRLYDTVLHALGCRPQRLLHVGDNPLVDVTMALGRGIRALLAPTAKQEFRWRHGVRTRASGSLIVSSMLCELGRAGAAREPGEVPAPAAVLERTATQHLALLYLAGLRRVAYRTTARRRHPPGLLRGARRPDHQAFRRPARGRVHRRARHALPACLARGALPEPDLHRSGPDLARRLFSHQWDHLTLGEALRRIAPDGALGEALRARAGGLTPDLVLNHATAKRFAGFLTHNWALLEQSNAERYQLAVDYLRQEQLLTDEKTAFRAGLPARNRGRCAGAGR
jgi:FMN phosphatase YigB (HAD superfamily)